MLASCASSCLKSACDVWIGQWSIERRAFGQACHLECRQLCGRSRRMEQNAPMILDPRLRSVSEQALGACPPYVLSYVPRSVISALRRLSWRHHCGRLPAHNANMIGSASCSQRFLTDFAQNLCLYPLPCHMGPISSEHYQCLTQKDVLRVSALGAEDIKLCLRQ